MDGELVFGELKVFASTNNIILQDKDGGQITFTLGQGESLRDLVGALQKFGSLPALPSKVPGKGFFANLTGDGTAEIYQEGAYDKFNIGFKFSIYDGWPVVEAIDKGLAKAKDMIAHGIKTQQQTATTAGSDMTDLIEGML